MPRINRIFQDADLKLASNLALDDAAANHVARVLRLSTNDPLIIFNGQGGEFEAQISEIEKRRVQVKLLKHVDIEHESPVYIHLGQAVSRGEKMDFTIQKAVELGVNEITPLITERCNVKMDQARWDKRIAHWKKVIISACEQCGRNKIPKINSPEQLNHWLSNRHEDTRFILHPRDGKPTDSPTPTTIALLVGSEGGFSDNELEGAHQAHFTATQLGPRILRTETAALACIAVLQSQFGDFCSL